MEDDSFVLANVNFRAFSASRVDDALIQCINSEYVPLFFTELIRLVSTYSNHPYFKEADFITPSVRVLGHIDGGSFALFLHSVNYLNKISGLEEALSNGLVAGSAVFPRREVGKCLHEHSKWVSVVRNPLSVNCEFDRVSFAKSDLYDALCIGQSNSSFLDDYCSSGKITVELGSFEKKSTARFLALKRAESGDVKIYAPGMLEPCSMLGFKE